MNLSKFRYGLTLFVSIITVLYFFLYCYLLILSERNLDLKIAIALPSIILAHIGLLRIIIKWAFNIDTKKMKKKNTYKKL